MSPNAFQRFAADVSALNNVIQALAAAHPGVSGDAVFPSEKGEAKRFKRLVDNAIDSLRAVKRFDSVDATAQS